MLDGADIDIRRRVAEGDRHHDQSADRRGDAAVRQGCRADQDGHADEADTTPRNRCGDSLSSANRRCDSTATISGDEAWIIPAGAVGTGQRIGHEHVRQPAVESAENGPDPPFMPLRQDALALDGEPYGKGRAADQPAHGRQDEWVLVPLSLINRRSFPTASSRPADWRREGSRGPGVTGPLPCLLGRHGSSSEPEEIDEEGDQRLIGGRHGIVAQLLRLDPFQGLPSSGCTKPSQRRQT